MSKYFDFTVKLLFTVAISLIFSNCNLFEKKLNLEYTVPEVRGFAFSAVKGDSAANAKLNNIIDSTFRLPVVFDYIKVDSIISEKGKYFLVLLSHKNPFYNRLALYDKDLKQLLLDKSLNGEIVLKHNITQSKLTIEATENFYSKDIIKITRHSIYEQVKNSFVLVFRTYSKLALPDKTYEQHITNYGNDSISTNIVSTIDGDIGNDVFFFNKELNRYVSESNTFEKIVMTEVSDNVNQPINPQLMYDLTNKNQAEDDPNYFLQNNHFLLNLPKNWTLFKNYSASENFKKPIVGFKYLCDSLNSSIFVAPLRAEDAAENFIDTKLSNKSKGKYKVVFSDTIEEGNFILQFYEFSCSNRKFLLLIQIDKANFKTSKKYFEDIINSFTIDC